MPDERAGRFSILYTETRAQIVAYAVRRTASREDAADVVAETFAIAWRRFDDIPSGRAALLWLYVTARHVLQNRSRRLRRDDDLLERLAVQLGTMEPREEPQDAERLFALFALNSLPDADRELVMLAAWEGLSAAELGRVLGCSATAARIRLHRARLRLKADLTELSRPLAHPEDLSPYGNAVSRTSKEI